MLMVFDARFSFWTTGKPEDHLADSVKEETTTWGYFTFWETAFTVDEHLKSELCHVFIGIFGEDHKFYNRFNNNSEL